MNIISNIYLSFGYCIHSNIGISLFAFLSFRLHVVDLDPSSVTSGGWLEDTSLVEKYKISDEAYNKLDGMPYFSLYKYAWL